MRDPDVRAAIDAYWREWAAQLELETRQREQAAEAALQASLAIFRRSLM